MLKFVFCMTCSCLLETHIYDSMALERTVMPCCYDITCNTSRYRDMHQLPLATPMHSEHSISSAASSALAHGPAPACARAPMPPGLSGRRAAEESSRAAHRRPTGPPTRPRRSAQPACAPDHNRSRLHGQGCVRSAEPPSSQLGRSECSTRAHAYRPRTILGRRGSLLHAP